MTCNKSYLGEYHSVDRGEFFDTELDLTGCEGEFSALLIMGHVGKKNSSAQWTEKDRVDIDVDMGGDSFFSDTGKLVIEDPPKGPFSVRITNTHGKTQNLRLRTFAYPA
jgi:hypothetical protein